MILFRASIKTLFSETVFSSCPTVFSSCLLYLLIRAISRCITAYDTPSSSTMIAICPLVVAKERFSASAILSSLCFSSFKSVLSMYLSIALSCPFSSLFFPARLSACPNSLRVYSCCLSTTFLSKSYKREAVEEGLSFFRFLKSLFQKLRFLLLSSSIL